MNTIKVAVRNKIATKTDDTEYICGNSDFVLAFDFDEEWDVFDVKTARFAYEGKYQDIVFTGNECPVPVMSNTHRIYVGVYAGNLCTTTPAYIPARKSILCDSGTPEAPSEDVYAQIMELIQGLNDPEAIAAAVAEYMANNPVTVTETDPTVPAWAKASSKPNYSKNEVGLGNVENVKQYSASNPPPYPVVSVNGKTGAVNLDADSVGARPSTWTPTASEVGALPSGTKIPAKTSELNNDSGFITGYKETDPTVPAWAKASAKPSYSKSEVGLGNVDNVKQYSASNPPPYPVSSVNGKTGAVRLSAADVGARSDGWVPTAEEVGALPYDYTAVEYVMVSDDGISATHSFSEICELVQRGRQVVFVPQSGAFSVDVGFFMPFSNTAEGGAFFGPVTFLGDGEFWCFGAYVTQEGMVDYVETRMPIPAKTSDLTNDSGFITGYTETDPTVPAWAKASTKPSYSKSEVGLGNVDNVKQYSANNPPPYPVSSVNGKTGAVSLSASDVGARPSTWTPTAANVGAVPTSRKINGKALSADITLSAADVGAVPTTSALTVTGVDADGVTHTWTIYGVSV